jgi:hypothetical protein
LRGEKGNDAQSFMRFQKSLDAHMTSNSAHPRLTHSAEKKRVSRGGSGLRGPCGGSGFLDPPVGTSIVVTGSGRSATVKSKAPSLKHSCAIEWMTVGSPLPVPLMTTPSESTASLVRKSKMTSLIVSDASHPVAPSANCTHRTSSFHKINPNPERKHTSAEIGN